MAELREVFEMVTKQTEPDVDAWREQEQRQRRSSRNRKWGALAVAAVIGIVAVVVVIRAVEDPAEPQPGGQGDTNATVPVPILPNGAVDPGRYLFTPDPDIDASYTITMEVPEGYEGGEGAYIQEPGSNQTGLVIMAIGDVHADACQWRGTRSAISSTDAAVAALVNQKGIRTSAPTDVMLDGFAASYMERTIPAQAGLSECDQFEFRTWVETGGGARYLGAPGQVDLLWILDIDGIPLVIDVSLEPGTSEQVRAELLQMVESIQIERT